MENLNGSGFGLGWKSSTLTDRVALSEECLSAAEEAAQQVVNCIHPTMDSEEKRRDIVDYIQRLIKSHLNCEVIKFISRAIRFDFWFNFTFECVMGKEAWFY